MQNSIGGKNVRDDKHFRAGKEGVRAVHGVRRAKSILKPGVLVVLELRHQHIFCEPGLGSHLSTQRFHSSSYKGANYAEP